ncbi:hypothetical protein [Methanobacterium subterraneum]|uniref:Uncharacterized protein n=1 Tax=Methanobacterium subterraneum TaxID=59277 RepID=A0A7K4DM06_9EURY|nr:hypothetical protein [Methanobacterium subterraneum]NMO09503.1 hypothetical protein [Methanobacterium subterraneum]
MPEIETLEEGTLKPIIISGNALDIYLYELEEKAGLLDFQGVQLEQEANICIDTLVEHGTGVIGIHYDSDDFKSPEDVDKEINRLYTESGVIYEYVKKIKNIMKEYGTSELKIRYKEV